MVMEHREAPRVGSDDRPFDGGPAPALGAFRLRRFDAEGNRRKVDFPRAGLLAVAGLALAGCTLYLADRARRAAFDWLADQPQYQIPFEQIELVVEPPRWYEGGSHAFLEGVRKTSREPEHIFILAVSRNDLKSAFKKYPWVDEVTRVTYPPGRVRVELRYRRPVAWVQLRAADQILIDEEGTVLPAADVDVAALGRVVKITGVAGTSPASATKYGERWKSK
jgi:hypothetical protein